MNKVLKLRVDKAKAAAKFAKVMNRDATNRIDQVLVPGTDGGRYIVQLSRLDHTDLITTICKNETGNCKGNQVTACYHSMAALIVAANGKGSVSFCDDEATATRRSNLGGKVVYLRGQGTGKSVWTVLERAKSNSSLLKADAALPVAKPTGSRMFK